jgi:DMSO reductase anchor subunit
MGLYALGAVFMGETWRLLGLLGTALSLATVFTTSMIYTQLKTIPRWNMKLTPAVFMSFSLAGGALLAGQTNLSIVLLLIAGAVQLAYWKQGDQALASSGTDIGTATGLGARGAVRAFEPPHTGSNYLLREFVHVVGRKHAQKLRVIAFALGFALPLILLLLPMEDVMVKHLFAAVAVLAHLAGVATSRWLFFAEAEHVVGLYYGKR